MNVATPEVVRRQILERATEMIPLNCHLGGLGFRRLDINVRLKSFMQPTMFNPDSPKGMVGFLTVPLILLAVHTILSMTILFVFEKTAVVPNTGEPSTRVVNTRQIDQNTTIVKMEKKEFQLVKTLPSVVIFYIWSGYIGIALSLIVALYSRLRS